MPTKKCLIYPPSPFASEPAMNPPLGLSYLSAMLKGYGHIDPIVNALDYSLHRYDYERDNFLFEIPLNQDSYLIYCMTSQYYWVKKIINYIQSNNKDATIHVGGPHATTCPDDFVELSVNEIVKGYVEPIMDREMKSLNDIPMPDREAFGLMQYKRTMGESAAIHLMTLRGCPYQCAYCDKKSVGSKVQYRSVENVMFEIDWNIIRYGIKSFVIYDDIFTLDHDRVSAFCREFRNRDIKWRCWSRADTLNREILKEMKASGLTSITLGIESGSDKILKNINKGLGVNENWNALLFCREIGIPVRCSLMFGNPGEDRESIESTIRMISKTTPTEWNVAVLNPVPGSAIWDNPEKFNTSFDKEALKENDYRQLNRFGGASGIGEIIVEQNHDCKKHQEQLLNYFLSELNSVCKRNYAQDTIQEIKCTTT